MALWKEMSNFRSSKVNNVQKPLQKLLLASVFIPNLRRNTRILAFFMEIGKLRFCTAHKERNSSHAITSPYQRVHYLYLLSPMHFTGYAICLQKEIAWKTQQHYHSHISSYLCSVFLGVSITKLPAFLFSGYCTCDSRKPQAKPC